MKFEIDTQLTTRLENDSVTEINRLVSLLKERQVSVLAVSQTEAKGGTIVRLTARDGAAAQRVLAENGYEAELDTVIAIEESNGQLAALAQTLSRCGVSIDFSYPSCEPDSQASRLILKVSNIVLASRIVEATAPAA